MNCTYVQGYLKKANSDSNKYSKPIYAEHSSDQKYVLSSKMFPSQEKKGKLELGRVSKHSFIAEVSFLSLEGFVALQ